MKIFVLIAALICNLTIFAQIEFIPNEGQFYDFEGKTHPEILYKLEKPNGNVYFKKDGLFFQFYSIENKKPSEFTKDEQEAYENGNLGFIGHKVFYYQMDLDLINANPNVSVSSGAETDMVRNYYLAHCPNGITNVKATDEITYNEIYPNIDLRFYSLDGKLKYDFILHPGADPKDISFTYNGFDDLKLLNGGVEISNPVTTYIDAAPVAFTKEGKNVNVLLNYNPETKKLGYSLELDKITETVIIDPTMEWGTYFNGTTSATWTRPVFDSNENMYNAGYTSDASFPVLNAGAGQYFDGTKDGSNDLVIVKFNADHSQAWATYYGGEMSDYLAGYTDYGKAIAINYSNEVYVAGLVQSGTTTFPTFDAGGSSWYQDQTHIYGETSFILKFDENGIRQWATMFQHENGASTSSEGIRINGIACDGDQLFFTGQLYNWNGSGIPIRTLAGAYNNSTYVGAQDPFIGKFNWQLGLDWCTYLNGGSPSNQAYSQGVDLHIDNNYNLWFVGRETMGTAGSHVLMNPGGGAYYQSTHGGDQDLIITKFNSSLAMEWSTYYGGDGQDIPSMITTDNNDNPLIICRSVKSTNWPTTNPGGGAFFDNSLSGATNQESGILKFSNSGVATWCTYIGGTGTSTSMTGIGTDANNNIYVSGSTNSSDFPVMNETGSYYDGTLGGSSDAVFARFTPNGVMEWGTYYGGSGNESLYSGKGAVLSGACSGDLVAFGFSGSSDINLVDPGSGAYYQSSGAANNSFIFYLSENVGSSSTAPTGINIVSGSNNICEGETVFMQVAGGTIDMNDQYYWYKDGCGAPGLLQSSGTGMTGFPSTTTTYYVRAEGPCGVTSCASITINVNPLPTASISGNATVCEGASDQTVTFTGSSATAPYTFSYTVNGGATQTVVSNGSGIATLTQTAGTAGSFTYDLVDVTEASASTCSQIQTGTVVVTVNPNPDVDAVNDQVLCKGEELATVNFTGTVSGTSYDWTNDNTAIGLSSSGNGDIVAFNVTGTAATETATIVVTPQANGCVGPTESFTITVNSVDNSISSVDGITITASATGAQYQWVNCDNNFSWINGQTGPSFTATDNGNYAVIVTQNNCSDTSECYNVNKISLNENGMSFGVNIYPNPTSGKFQIQIEHFDSPVLLSVVDGLGKVVFEQNLLASASSVDLSNLAEGVYQIHLSNETNMRKTIPVVLTK